MNKDLIEFETIEVVKCHHCGKLHNKDGTSFYTVYGNIMVGLAGGLVGNNIDEDLKVVRVHFFCRKCLMKVLEVDDEKPISFPSQV